MGEIVQMLASTNNCLSLLVRFQQQRENGNRETGEKCQENKQRDGYGQIHQVVTKSHRWEHWREADPARMLHMRNDRRFKMGKAVNNYLIANTES